MEVTKFTQCLRTYIQTGFRGAPPESNIYMYILPFISATWWASLENKNVRTKILESHRARQARVVGSRRSLTDKLNQMTSKDT